MQLAADTRKVQFFFRTSEAWDVMYRDCRQAAVSIDFEQYILMDDKAGHRFLELFAAKAKAGVRVRLIFDGAGSRNLHFHALLDEVKKAGGIVHFYNDIISRNIFSPFRWLPRNHVKTLLIDGKIAHTGSSCIWEIMKDWHEVHVRFTSGAVHDVERQFAKTWECVGKGYRLLRAARPASHDQPVRYVVSEPKFRLYPVYQELLEEIRRAKRHIRIVTPYFVPPRRLRLALQRAAARGVQVEILMSAETDVPLADHISHSYFPRLLQKGLRLFLYPQTVLHAKYAMIDDNWATVGSTNMDYLSLLKNREANLLIRDPQLVAELWKKSDAYIRESRVADMQYCRDIPWHHRLVGYFGRCMKEVI